VTVLVASVAAGLGARGSAPGILGVMEAKMALDAGVGAMSAVEATLEVLAMSEALAVAAVVAVVSLSEAAASSV